MDQYYEVCQSKSVLNDVFGGHHHHNRGYLGQLALILTTTCTLQFLLRVSVWSITKSQSWHFRLLHNAISYCLCTLLGASYHGNTLIFSHYLIFL